VVFLRLKTALTAHARAEEACFYEILKTKGATREDAFEGYEEHHLVDILFQEMSRLEPDDPRWSAKFAVLHESLEHHIAEEEGKLFLDAESVLSRKHLVELGGRFETDKRRRLANAARRRRGAA